MPQIGKPTEIFWKAALRDCLQTNYDRLLIWKQSSDETFEIAGLPKSFQAMLRMHIYVAVLENESAVTDLTAVLCKMLIPYLLTSGSRQV